MKTIEYLDALKKKLQLSSDYQLAKRLGVSTQRISNYRTRYSTFDPTLAARVAELLEVDPLKVIADTELERATKPAHRKLWERIASKVAAGVLVAIGAGISAPSPTSAAPVDSSVYYVKSTRRRSWFFPLVPPLEPPDELLT